MLDRADYEAVGGVGQALANTAAAVLGRLSDEDRALARIVLLRLVTPGDATADTRRRVRFEMLLETGEGEAVTRVVDAFASARLLSSTSTRAQETAPSRWPTRPCCSGGRRTASGSTRRATTSGPSNGSELSRRTGWPTSATMPFSCVGATSPGTSVGGTRRPFRSTPPRWPFSTPGSKRRPPRPASRLGDADGSSRCYPRPRSCRSCSPCLRAS